MNGKFLNLQVTKSLTELMREKEFRNLEEEYLVKRIKKVNSLDLFEFG